MMIKVFVWIIRSFQYVVIYIVYGHSPLWSLAFLKSRLHSSISLVRLLHPRMPRICNAGDSPSILFLVLRLIAWTSPLITFLGSFLRPLWFDRLSPVFHLEYPRYSDLWEDGKTSLVFVRFFVCEVGWRAKFTKERWMHETNCSLSFWMLLPT